MGGELLEFKFSLSQSSLLTFAKRPKGELPGFISLGFERKELKQLVKAVSMVSLGSLKGLKSESIYIKVFSESISTLNVSLIERLKIVSTKSMTLSKRG